MAIHTTQVIYHWAVALQEGFPSEGILKALAADAVEKFRGQLQPWARCFNPAEVYLLTCRRVGLEPVGARFLTDETGATWDLLAVSPSLAKMLAWRAHWRSSDQRALRNISGGGWEYQLAWPLLKQFLYGRRKQWTRHHRNSVRNTLCGSGMTSVSYARAVGVHCGTGASGAMEGKRSAGAT